MTTVFNVGEARQVLKREQARNKVRERLALCLRLSLLSSRAITSCVRAYFGV